MELPTPPPELARMGLRGIKMLATADGEFHDLERGLMNAAQKHILKTDFDIDELEPITPDELAAGVPIPEFRERIFNACLITALIDGEASEAEAKMLDSYAEALGVSSPALKDVHRLVDDNLLLFRFDVARRSFIGQRGRAFLKKEGLRGISSVIRSLLNTEHPKTAERYRALVDHPEGTLGRGYADFIRNNEFSFPGEIGGPPEPIVFHDCLHVIGEYDTSSLEETQIASFQAGMLKKDPIFGMFFMLAQFQLGVQVTPTTGPEKHQVDPEKMIQAFVRGTKVNLDMCTAWDPWDDFDQPATALREKYNVVPRD